MGVEYLGGGDTVPVVETILVWREGGIFDVDGILGGVAGGGHGGGSSGWGSGVVLLRCTYSIA